MNLYIRLLLLRVLAMRRGKLSIWGTARTPFRVAPTDLDVLGHMNNGKYLSLMDLGRMDLMLRSGMWKQLSARGWYPVVAGQTITYRKSLQPGQKFDLLTRVLGFDDRWGYLEQTFVRGDTIYAQAVIRSRFLKKTGGSVDHDDLETLVGGFPTDLTVPQWSLDWATATRTPTAVTP